MKRTVLVTGASSGIGRAVADTLAAKGHRVIEVSRRSETRIDLSELDALETRLPKLVAENPDVDALVLSAGRGRFGSLEEFSYRQIRELVDLNLTSQICVARAFLPSMKTRGAGDVVFIGSEVALSPDRRGAVYSATKAGVTALARALRMETGKSGVRISVIHPGMVKTDFYGGLGFEPGSAEGEFLTPQDVARVVSELLETRPGAVWAEIHLSPLKKVIRFR